MRGRLLVLLPLLNDASGHDEIELRKIFLEICVSLHAELTLCRAAPSALVSLAVAAVQRVHDVHAVADLADRIESRFVERRVVAEVDEQLRRARVWSGGGEGEPSARVALRDGIIGEVQVAPHS